ncbi:GGDEF domain-containing protein [Couchioplanes caeruleus]|uniref:GGDEF domain-containing protein n=1 Tax=Couchioplanes caeruleus TaxID=56438 RepID=UPI0020BDFF4B|nr:GGDEF domain-containing protein [Couchioplanes caeruleus]UQU61485.1 GGDEF domain-containing protein [Couchioplanes caeruleus]
MHARSWKAFAIAMAVVIAGYQLIPDDAVWVTCWQVGVGWAGTAAVVVGARRLPRRDRLPWWCFGAGIFANSTGIAVAMYVDTVLGWEDLPTPADPFFLLLYPACAAGLAVLIRRREPGRNWTAMVDATTITTGLGLLAWVYVIEPAATEAGLSLFGRSVQVAYPIGDLLLLAMLTRLLRSGGVRGASFWWIAGALGGFLAGDTTWVVLGNLGDVGWHLEEIQWFRRCIDMMFLTAFALVGVAALHADARDMGRPVAPRPPRLSRIQLLALTGASLIAPAILAAQLASGQVKDGPAIVVGSTALFLLVVTRMAQLVRQVEQQSRQVRELSRTDELTGLPNRRAWNDELPRALEHSRRDGAPVCVAVLDLDRFKQFNDSYGHPAGDRLLKEASAAWHGALRTVDTIARFGGEEFTVLLPGTDATAALAVLQRALAATPLGQTFSAGVAAWDGVETSDQLIERADAALYEAKDGGRNRIVPAKPRTYVHMRSSA